MNLQYHAGYDRWVEYFDMEGVRDAWNKHFEDCVDDGGFMMDLFLEKMEEEFEVWILSREDRELLRAFLELEAREEYSELCEHYKD